MTRDRRVLWILLGILVLAFCLRMAHFREIRGAAFTVSPVIDASQFHKMAQEIASGRLVGETAYQKAPLYPYILGLIYSIAGVRIPVVIALQLTAGVLTCLLVFILGRRLFGAEAGLAAAALAAVYRPFIAFEGQLLAAWLAVLLTTVYLLTQEWASRSGGAVRWSVAGAILGLASLVRGNLLLLVPFGLLWIIVPRRPAHAPGRAIAAVVFCLGVFLPLIPSTVHNYLAEGEVIPLTTTAGINLYTGNRPGADGFSAIPVHSRWEEAMDEAWEAVQGTTVERDRYWIGETGRAIAGNPLAFVALWVKKAVLFWDGFEYPNNLSFEFLKQASGVLRFPFPGFGVIAPLALGGLVFLRRKRAESVEFIGLFLVLYMFSVLPFFACDRYRLPAVPAILCLAGGTVVWFYRRIKGREFRFTAAAAMVAVLAVFVNVDLYGARPDHVARDWVATGDAFRFADRYPQALRAYKLAIEQDPGDPDPYALAGVCLLRLGRLREAERGFQEALRLNPRYTRPRVLLARLLLEKGRAEEAVPHLEFLADRYPYRVEPRILLSRALFSLGRREDAEARFLEASKLDSNLVPPWGALTEVARVD